MMRVLMGAGGVIALLAGLAACTAASPRGPNVTVTTPAVGRPQPPSSIEAALSSEAFTPYAALGESNADGLASGESYYALAEACMRAKGYPDPVAGTVGISISLSPENLAFAQTWGSWGYLGVAEAQQNGFQLPPGSAAAAELGISVPSAAPSGIPAAEQAASRQCTTIVMNFTKATQDSELGVITTLSNDIYRDVRQDPAVMKATRIWSACMSKNGYSFGQPANVFFTEFRQMHGGQSAVTPGEQVSPAEEKAQLATAVSDAQCTQSADLAGIYFTVQASYEQQIVTANQQALSGAVRQFRRAYARELGKLRP